MQKLVIAFLCVLRESFAHFAVKGFLTDCKLSAARYCLSELCRNAILVPFNSKRLSRHTYRRFK